MMKKSKIHPRVKNTHKGGQTSEKSFKKTVPPKSKLSRDMANAQRMAYGK